MCEKSQSESMNYLLEYIQKHEICGLKLMLLPSILQLDKYGQYAGYRHAYHLLMYGGKRNIELLDVWAHTRDCTFDAACDFYGTKDP